MLSKLKKYKMVYSTQIEMDDELHPCFFRFGKNCFYKIFVVSPQILFCRRGNLFSESRHMLGAYRISILAQFRILAVECRNLCTAACGVGYARAPRPCRAEMVTEDGDSHLTHVSYGLDIVFDFLVAVIRSEHNRFKETNRDIFNHFKLKLKLLRVFTKPLQCPYCPEVLIACRNGRGVEVETLTSELARHKKRVVVKFLYCA